MDLYKVVREGIRVSEPRYSIKNIEHFYLESRTGDVKSAGASIVYYERWKETGDAQLLQEIADYNLDDVRSTYELREWLLTLRPAATPWFVGAVPDKKDAPEVGELTEAEQRLVPYRERLVDPLPQDRSTWGETDSLNELAYQLLDFHRRAAKPEWWVMFSRMEMTEEELFEDGECLAFLRVDPANPPVKQRTSIQYNEMIRRLVKAQEAAARTARKLFPHVDKANDQATADVLTQRIDVHEKTAWMLRSLLED